MNTTLITICLCLPIGHLLALHHKKVHGRYSRIKIEIQCMVKIRRRTKTCPPLTHSDICLSMASRVNLIEMQPQRRSLPVTSVVPSLHNHCARYQLHEAKCVAGLSRHICLHYVLLSKFRYSIFLDQPGDSQVRGSVVDGCHIFSSTG